jgi:hypothetical protein
MTSNKLAFFKIKVDRQIDTANEVFAISCLQQGQRLKSYRQKLNNPKKFENSEFSIMLMTASGEWVGGTHGGSHTFNYSLLLKEGTLEAGEYVVLVDPTWNNTADFHPDYKKVLVDVYAPGQTSIEQMSKEEGLEVLAKTLKFVAQNKVAEDKRQYPHENKEDYGKQVYRINDISASKCWLGFSYLRNDSKFAIKETALPELKGFEVVGKQEPYVMEAAAGSDDIMILRRTQGACEYRIPF